MDSLKLSKGKEYEKIEQGQLKFKTFIAVCYVIKFKNVYI